MSLKKPNLYTGKEKDRERERERERERGKDVEMNGHT